MDSWGHLRPERHAVHAVHGSVGSPASELIYRELAFLGTYFHFYNYTIAYLQLGRIDLGNWTILGYKKPSEILIGYILQLIFSYWVQLNKTYTTDIKTIVKLKKNYKT